MKTENKALAQEKNKLNKINETYREKIRRQDMEIVKLQTQQLEIVKHRPRHPNVQLKNPYIVIVGIEKYTNKKWCNLDGVKKDVLKMTNLWYNIYGYKNMSIICSFNVEKMIKMVV